MEYLPESHIQLRKLAVLLSDGTRALCHLYPPENAAMVDRQVYVGSVVPN